MHECVGFELSAVGVMCVVVVGRCVGMGGKCLSN